MKTTPKPVPIVARRPRKPTDAQQRARDEYLKRAGYVADPKREEKIRKQWDESNGVKR